MKRVLVTGGAGFVGANLVRRLLEDGHELHLLLRPDTNAWRVRDLFPHVRAHLVSLEDADAVHASVREARPEWIFHLAAHGAYSWQRDLERMVRTNLLGTAHLMEAALDSGCEAFVNTGSSSEYGVKDHAPDEDDLPEPNSRYAVTKAAATLYCGFAARSRAARVMTLRLYSVYGPWEEPNRLIPTLIAHGLRGALPPLVNPGIARDFVYVTDVVEAYLLAAAGDGIDPRAVYNVGTGRQVSIAEAVETARRVLGVLAAPEWGSMPDRAWDTGTWVADSRRIREELGWRPAVEFEEGFRRTVEWLRADPERLEFYARRQQEPRR